MTQDTQDGKSVLLCSSFLATLMYGLQLQVQRFMITLAKGKAYTAKQPCQGSPSLGPEGKGFMERDFFAWLFFLSTGPPSAAIVQLMSSRSSRGTTEISSPNRSSHICSFRSWHCTSCGCLHMEPIIQPVNLYIAQGNKKRKFEFRPGLEPGSSDCWSDALTN